MQPLFYIDDFPEAQALVALSEETARHLVQVLRKAAGYEIMLTNGKGKSATAVLETTGKKAASVRILTVQHHPKTSPGLILAVAFTKAAARNEWMLEKATELGVARIVPLLTQRSESEKFRKERWQNILVSALQQSHQYWLPQLSEPVKLAAFLPDIPDSVVRFIAHCIDDENRKSFANSLPAGKDAVLMIGPEGDFTPDEIRAALDQHFMPVTLGENRLRTETAAIAGASYFRLLNDA